MCKNANKTWNRTEHFSLWDQHKVETPLKVMKKTLQRSDGGIKIKLRRTYMACAGLMFSADQHKLKAYNQLRQDGLVYGFVLSPGPTNLALDQYKIIEGFAWGGKGNSGLGTLDKELVDLPEMRNEYLELMAVTRSCPLDYIISAVQSFKRFHPQYEKCSSNKNTIKRYLYSGVRYEAGPPVWFQMFLNWWWDGFNEAEINTAN